MEKTEKIGEWPICQYLLEKYSQAAQLLILEYKVAFTRCYASAKV